MVNSGTPTLFARSAHIALLLWCQVIPFPGVSQVEMIRFNRLSDEEGLPNNLYTQIIQDRDGILWMAGIDGLARYDGYTIQAYRHNFAEETSLSGNNITALYEDTRGRLWVGFLNGGLNVSDRSKTKFRSIMLPEERADTPAFTVSAITEDATGYIWAGTSAGLMMIEIAGDTYRWLTSDEYLPGISLPHQVNILYTSVQGQTWIGTGQGLYMYDGRKRQVMSPHHFHTLPASSIHDIGEDRLGRLWISCRNNGPRLYYTAYDPFDFKSFDGIPFQSPSRSIRFAFDLDNRIWISVFGEQAYGYDFRDSTLFLNTAVNTDISHERFFRKPFVDHSGNTWLPMEGFYIYPYPKGFNTYNHPFAFHQSNSGVYGYDDLIWMAIREHGIVRWDKKANTTVHFSSRGTGASWLPTDHIQDILRVGSGNLIIAGHGNIAVMAPDGRILKHFPTPGNNRAIFEDTTGRIWVGGYDGLYLFSEQYGILQTITLPPFHNESRNFIQCIVEDAKGRIWFGSDLKGLAVLQPADGSVRQFLPHDTTSYRLPGYSIYDMRIGKDNIIWLATDVGLTRFDTDSLMFRIYDRRHGIENDYIAALELAKDGRIWVSTHSGISVFDPAQERFTNYSRGDGLANTSYYNRSVFLDCHGILYFGGKNGVDYFDPAKLRINPVAPRMHLSGLRINGRKTVGMQDIEDNGGLLRLTYKDMLVECEIAGLYYADQAGVRYWYRMDGMHDDWIELGIQRHIAFSGIPPGEYRFRAKAVSGDSLWTADELVIPIYVSPPFYGTAWFRGIMLCFVLALAVLLVRLRENYIRKKDRQAARVKREMAELEKRALLAQMNPHFIYNSMNSIQQFMILHDVEGAMKYLTRFSRILRTVLNVSAQSRVPLYDEIRLIEDYLELENMRFPDKFTYTLRVDPGVNIHTAEIPPFFIQPQVENAIRHGLLKKSTPGHLQIHIRTSGAYLHITVEDDGIGREAALRAKQMEGLTEESKGLAIMEERLSHLHTVNGQHNPIRITDLYDPSGAAAGTRIEISLPIE